MTEFRVREAQAKDAPIIRDLVESAELNPSSLAWERFTVAVDASEQIVGCAQVRTHRGDVRELASVTVRANGRGRGVARALLEHLLEKHPRPVHLMCLSGLEGLYHKFGFKVVPPEAMPAYFRRFLNLPAVRQYLSEANETVSVMVLE
jgi:N-acetylglutamate synthase-like GNAT family acetyltransferase